MDMTHICLRTNHTIDWKTMARQCKRNYEIYTENEPQKIGTVQVYCNKKKANSGRENLCMADLCFLPVASSPFLFFPFVTQKIMFICENSIERKHKYNQVAIQVHFLCLIMIDIIGEKSTRIFACEENEILSLFHLIHSLSNHHHKQCEYFPPVCIGSGE
jgi:hypothetical protein